MGKMKRVLIANRGEIACRIARSCRDLGVATVAVCSDADENALHVRCCDEYRVIGPARAQHSYLNGEKVLQAARETDADAIHPGYGFMAENAPFAEAVMHAGLTWIGPRPESITEMGDKARARRIAEDAGVPVVPGSESLDSQSTADAIAAAAEKIGYPLLVKASAGGGGIGMKRVDHSEDLHRAVQETQGLAKANFGDDTVFLERFIPHARHIEVQILGFGGGEAVHLFERECSIQRRYQKIIEEAPSSVLRDDIRQEMTQAALSLAQAQSYESAGTVEFIFDDDTGRFYFLEMNTRIQVEHPVTEMVTGEDIVAHQILVAQRQHPGLKQEDVLLNGHSIELRIYAEDPFNGFMPQPGVLEIFEFPSDDPSIRLDTGYESGSKIPPYYDPLVAKLIVYGVNRDSAIEKAKYALENSRVSGIKTNIPFLLNVLSNPAFCRGDTHTSFIQDHESDLFRLT